MFKRNKEMTFKVVNTHKKLVELTRAEQLLIETIRDIKDLDEFVKQVKKMDSGHLKSRLLNVATDKIAEPKLYQS
ncbi:hypothetical protein [Robertmurraya sp. FSL R5-0851]|uniref:hypothetical protein n=1 Tax=Robertmurraya sp. FSL R5-0851 TaxID=2921584 RepID=UPI0030FA3B8E